MAPTICDIVAAQFSKYLENDVKTEQKCEDIDPQRTCLETFTLRTLILVNSMSYHLLYH